MTQSVTCNVCCEELVGDERDFYPCSCGYQVCLWCVNEILISCDSHQCPACRQVYDTGKYDEHKHKWVAINGSKKDIIPSGVISQAHDHGKDTRKSQPPPSDPNIILYNTIVVAGFHPDVLVDTKFPLPEDYDKGLCSDEYFGKFGSILDFKSVVLPQSGPANIFGGIPTQLKGMVMVWVTFQSIGQAKRALEAYTFRKEENTGLLAAPALQQYCMALMLGRRCHRKDTKKGCLYYHDTYTPPLFLPAEAKKIDTDTGFQAALAPFAHEDMGRETQLTILGALSGEPRSTPVVTPSVRSMSASASTSAHPILVQASRPPQSAGTRASASAAAVSSSPSFKTAISATPVPVRSPPSSVAASQVSQSGRQSPTILRPPAVNRSWNWGGAQGSSTTNAAPALSAADIIGEGPSSIPLPSIEDLIGSKVKRPEKKKKTVSADHSKRWDTSSRKGKMMVMDPGYFTEAKTMKELGELDESKRQEVLEECSDGHITSSRSQSSSMATPCYSPTTDNTANVTSRLASVDMNFTCFDLIDLSAWEKQRDSIRASVLQRETNECEAKRVAKEEIQKALKVFIPPEQRAYLDQMAAGEHLDLVMQTYAELGEYVRDEHIFWNEYSVQHLEAYFNVCRKERELISLGKIGSEQEAEVENEKCLIMQDPYFKNAYHSIIQAGKGHESNTSIAYQHAVNLGDHTRTAFELAARTCDTSVIQNRFLLTWAEQNWQKMGLSVPLPSGLPQITFPSYAEVECLRMQLLASRIPFSEHPPAEFKLPPPLLAQPDFLPELLLLDQQLAAVGDTMNGRTNKPLRRNYAHGAPVLPYGAGLPFTAA